MSERDKKRNIANDTLDIMSKGYYINSLGNRVNLDTEQKFSEKNTIIYSPEQTDKLIKERISGSSDIQTKTEVFNDTTLNVVRNLITSGKNNILCLNFASAKNPGGGFLKGSQAQEESIARSTGLYNCLLKADDYYKTNRNTKSCFYTDYMIYSPNVPLFKDEKGKHLDELSKLSIITAPAVNANVVKQREPQRINEIEEVMKRRIEKVLSISIKNNHRIIVLGAWGCGVFGNNPEDVARYFKQIIDLKFKNEFELIVFAVLARSDKFIQPFYKEFRN